jgi:hypothetical protein
LPLSLQLRQALAKASCRGKPWALNEIEIGKQLQLWSVDDIYIQLIQFKWRASSLLQVIEPHFWWG